MAIAVSFGFLVIRKSSIQEKYSGGIDQFRQDWIRKRKNHPVTGEDEHLFGFYSMGGGTLPVIEKLQGVGFETDEKQSSLHLAFGDLCDGFLAPCTWLQIEELTESLNGKEPFMVCWLTGQDRGEVVEGEFY